MQISFFNNTPQSVLSSQGFDEVEDFFDSVFWLLRYDTTGQETSTLKTPSGVSGSGTHTTAVSRLRLRPPPFLRLCLHLRVARPRYDHNACKRHARSPNGFRLAGPAPGRACWSRVNLNELAYAARAT
eukprot:7141080-Prymnesium_polylepis.2